MLHRALLLVLVAVFPAVALADSWNPWRDKRVVSPNGKYYVVMKRPGGPKVYGEWGPVEFTVAERGEHTTPVTVEESEVVELGIDEYDPEKGGQGYEIQPNPRVRVRCGDKTLGRGELERPPLEIIVSDDGLGFVGLDVWGYNVAHHEKGRKADHAVVIVSSSGKVLHRRRLVDLFSDDELNAFDGSAGGLWWLNRPIPGWLIDANKQIVIVGDSSKTKPNNHLIRFVEWQTGKITNGPTQKSQDDVKILKRDSAK